MHTTDPIRSRHATLPRGRRPSPSHECLLRALRALRHMGHKAIRKGRRRGTATRQKLRSSRGLGLSGDTVATTALLLCYFAPCRFASLRVRRARRLRATHCVLRQRCSDVVCRVCAALWSRAAEAEAAARVRLPRLRRQASDTNASHEAHRPPYCKPLTHAMEKLWTMHLCTLNLSAACAKKLQHVIDMRRPEGEGRPQR